MNVDLGDLYQEVIIDHGRHPRNFGELAGATHTAEGFNPLCGDQLTLYVKLADGHIAAVAFQGAGCAISQASASLMTTALKGKNEEEALALFGRVHAMLTEGPNGGVRPAELGKLAVLSGVWEFPMRVKCATLAWHTLRSALEATAEPVSTE
ncbi:MAG: Fe-S cluster assembly sulfur transfer protein SufU [Acidimicrobiales bacterium]